jgi:ferrochelatase
VLLLPLYPQFAMATTETILVLAEEIRKKKFPKMEFTILPAFYNQKDYIRDLSNSIKRSLEEFKHDHLLFSYHGVPERHIKKSDITKSHCQIDGSCCNTPSKAHEFCYRHQCYETTKQVAEFLDLPEGTYSTSFQSRLGKDPWLQPYTDATIDGLAEKGIQNLAVVTPAFVSDCLETLEEIGMEAAHSFKEHGGKNFLAIPCLNDNEDWVKTLSRWVDQWALA